MQTKFFLLFLSVCFCLPSFSHAQSPKKFTVVLDAGHGGKDGGNQGNGYSEKDIALDVVLKVGDILEKHDDINLIYTRKKDVFVELNKRANIANDGEANLFVSVHCNSHSSQAAGTETFVLGLHRNKDNLEVAMRENSVIYLEENYEVTYGGFDPNSAESYIGMTLMQEEYLDQSILLASMVQENFTEELHRNNRGVKQAGFLVLREVYMPSVLVEMGFLTNDREGRYLNSEKGRNDIAKAIANAILEYKDALNLKLLEVSEEVSAPVQAQTEIHKGITFRVQLAASSNKLKPAPYNFKGLENVERAKEGKYYKYYFGSTSDYLKIQELHRKAKKAGFKTSYVVAFREGEKISVSQALKGKVE